MNLSSSHILYMDWIMNAFLKISINLQPDHHLMQLLLLSDQLVLCHLRLLQLLLKFPAALNIETVNTFKDISLL